MKQLLWIVADSRPFSLLRNEHFVEAQNALLLDHGVTFKPGEQYEPMSPDTAKTRVGQLRFDLRKRV
jgi:hypothetical protein